MFSINNPEARAELQELRNQFKNDRKIHDLLGVSEEIGFPVSAAQEMARANQEDAARKLAGICRRINKEFWARLIEENILGDLPTQ